MGHFYSFNWHTIGYLLKIQGKVILLHFCAAVFFERDMHFFSHDIKCSYHLYFNI